jgi:hypothetical protein
MTRDEETYVHFVSSSDDLNEAWRILGEIKKDLENPFVGAAFRYALVAYARPYVSSRGDHSSSYKLDERFIPLAQRELHRSLIAARHQIHAHSDLTVREAKLRVAKAPSSKRIGAAQNIIRGTEELANIDAIISTIEGTHDAMYDVSRRLEASLPVNS